MIPLHGRTTTSDWARLETDVWRVGEPGDGLDGNVAVRVGQEPPREGAALYLTDLADQTGPGPKIHLPLQLRHLAPGDVFAVSPDGSRVSVLWKADARHNSILLTERCDHYCIMCSQPPKERDDGYLFERAKRVIDSLPSQASAVTLTGGEPTIYPEAFLDLLRHIAATAPRLAVHVLSNGRRFADAAFSRAYASTPLADLMVGIPLYAAAPALHDYVVQSRGAFNETVRGILSLISAGARVEIRVVIQQANVAHLTELAYFIARNLPFVDQVALMGLEMTGLARPNSSRVWVDPFDYRSELSDAYAILHDAGVRTKIYNHQLCVLDERVRPAAVQSISDWKRSYPESCQPCAVREQCAGVFSTSGQRLSSHLSPLTA